MTTRKQTKRWMGVLAAGLSLALTAQAAVLLEFDFRNHDAANQQVTASAATSGASTTGQLLDHDGSGTGTYPTMNTGAIASLAGLQLKQAVKNGSMTALDDIGGNDDQRSIATSGTGSTYADYAGSTFGSGSLEFVYRPAAPLGGTRDTFFGYRPGDSSRQLWFLRNGSDLLLRIGNNYDTTLAAPAWDADTWYYLAASWEVGQPASIYWQELGGTTAASGTNVGNLVDGSPGTSAIHIGSRNNAFSATNENMDGELAFFRWTDSYLATVDDFDMAYDSLFVPEPTTVGLLGIGGLLLWMRRKQLIG